MRDFVTLTDTDAAATLFADLADSATEMLGIVYIDPKWMVLGERRLDCGRILSADVPIRQIVAEALELKASRVLIAHNHPSGDPTPSADDIAATRRLFDVLKALEIELVDHLILAGEARTSFRALGKL